MEWSPPPSPTSLVVRSPRQTLSPLKDRRPKPSPFSSSSRSFTTSAMAPSHLRLRLRGSITTVIATVIYLVWAYMPEQWLHSLGITYYPSKYWALAVPSFVLVALVLSMVLYMGSNFLVTPPPTLFNTIFDEYSHERMAPTPSMEAEKPIEPISDIGIDQINSLMFSHQR